MRLNAIVTVVIVFIFLCTVATADEATKANPDAKSDSSTAKNWEWSLAPMYLWAAFKSNGIIIPFPQREVHMIAQPTE